MRNQVYVPSSEPLLGHCRISPTRWRWQSLPALARDVILIAGLLSSIHNKVEWIVGRAIIFSL